MYVASPIGFEPCGLTVVVSSMDAPLAIVASSMVLTLNSPPTFITTLRSILH